MPIAVYTIGAPDLAEHDKAFFERYEIGRDGAALVRPDGYVAWRSATAHDDGAPLVHAVEQILARPRVAI